MKIKLTFFGAAQNVTGSRYLLEANGTKLLIDCGLYQERGLRHRNWDPFPVPPKEIDAVLLTHAHLDHCGLFPKLYHEGFRGKLHCTEATAQIARIIMEDSAHLQERDAELKQKRHRRQGRSGPHPVVPLYTVDDAQACAEHFSPVDYDQPLTLGDGIEAVFHNAGHILGASFIRIAIQSHGETRTVVFSGDIGRSDMPILKDPERFEQADYLLVESTYGNRTHATGLDSTEKLAEEINIAHQAGGKVIIPTFALERAQDILYQLNELMIAKRIPPMPSFLDSPMAIRVTDVFEKHPELFDRQMTARVRRDLSPFDLPGLEMTRKTEASKRINEVEGPAIILAGSGMCTGGRVKHHLVRYIGDPKSTILFVGYQAYGTLGREIVDGAKDVRILGIRRKVKARVARISGFSAHADRDELIAWLGGLKTPPRRAIVVHGEPDAANAFADLLREKNGWPVSVPAYGETLDLD